FGSASTHAPILRCDGTINPNNGAGNDLIVNIAQGTTTITGTSTDANFRLFDITVASGATLQAPATGTVTLGLQFGTLTNNGTINLVNGTGVVNINVVNNGINYYNFSNTAGNVQFNNLTVSTSATFRPVNTGTHFLRIAGNLVNTPGTYATTNGTGLLHTTFNGSAAQTISAAQTFQNLTISNTTATVTMSGALTIASGRAMVIDANARFDLGIQNLTLTGATCTVNGFFRRGGPTTNPTLTNVNATTLVFTSTGTYEHNFTDIAGTIPTANWQAGSTCAIIGYTTNTTNPGGLSQSFHHFNWNCAAQTANINLTGLLITINGNFDINSNTGILRFTAGTTFTLNIGGNLNFNGGTVELTTATGTPTINVTGNANFNAGTFRMTAGSGNPILNVAGNFSQSGGTFDFLFTGATVGSTLNIAGNVNQTAGTITRTVGSTHICDFNLNGSANQSINFAGTI
ncbi:MAG TPA: hypothetical protein PKD90_17335, partial [Phnomibacter sp.]|nr:hypothetical protein [Phnomibacter sp.]